MKEQIWVGKGRGQAPDAIKANGFIFLSAIRGEDPATRSCDTDDVGEQTRFAMENLKTVLAAAGATLNDVVRVAIYITDLSDRPAFNKVYREYFPADQLPARFAVGAPEVGGNDKSKFTLEVIALCRPGPLP